MTQKQITARLEYLRGEIEKECISYGEIAELQSLKEYIDKGDVLLLEWAGVPEDEEDECPECGSTTEIHKNSSDQIMCDNCGYCEGDEDEDNLSEEE